MAIHFSAIGMSRRFLIIGGIVLVGILGVIVQQFGLLALTPPVVPAGYSTVYCNAGQPACWDPVTAGPLSGTVEYACYQPGFPGTLVASNLAGMTCAGGFAACTGASASLLPVCRAPLTSVNPGPNNCPTTHPLCGTLTNNTCQPLTPAQFMTGGSVTNCPLGGDPNGGRCYKCDTGTTGIDLKINGSDGTITAALGDKVMLTWTSTGVQSCDTGTSPAPWGPSVPKGTSGSEQFTVTGTMTVGIHCSETAVTNRKVQDSVAVIVGSSSSAPALCPQCAAACGTLSATSNASLSSTASAASTVGGSSASAGLISTFTGWQSDACTQALGTGWYCTENLTDELNALGNSNSTFVDLCASVGSPTASFITQTGAGCPNNIDRCLRCTSAGAASSGNTGLCPTGSLPIPNGGPLGSSCPTVRLSPTFCPGGPSDVVVRSANTDQFGCSIACMGCATGNPTMSDAETESPSLVAQLIQPSPFLAQAAAPAVPVCSSIGLRVVPTCPAGTTLSCPSGTVSGPANATPTPGCFGNMTFWEMVRIACPAGQPPTQQCLYAGCYRKYASDCLNGTPSCYFLSSPNRYIGQASCVPIVAPPTTPAATSSVGSATSGNGGSAPTPSCPSNMQLMDSGGVAGCAVGDPGPNFCPGGVSALITGQQFTLASGCKQTCYGCAASSVSSTNIQCNRNGICDANEDSACPDCAGASLACVQCMQQFCGQSTCTLPSSSSALSSSRSSSSVSSCSQGACATGGNTACKANGLACKAASASPGYVCQGFCGNGELDPGETCDAGNACGSTCCTSSCQISTDPTCTSCTMSSTSSSTSVASSNP